MRAVLTRLVVIAGPDRGRELPIPSSGGVVGRGEGCSMKLTDAAVSREHFRIEVRDGQPVLIDLGSTNKTRVNGEPVDQRALDGGDLIAIGKTTLQLVPEGEVASVGGGGRVTLDLEAAQAVRVVGQGSSDATRLARYLSAMTQIGEALHGADGAVAAAEIAAAHLHAALNADRVQIVRVGDGGRRPALTVIAARADGGSATGVVPVEPDVIMRVLGDGRAAATVDDQREALVAPVAGEGRSRAVVIADRAVMPRRSWDRAAVELVAAAGHVLAAGLAAQEVRELLVRDRAALRERLAAVAGDGDFLGDSTAAAGVREFVARVTATGSTVLLLGESGVGKELVATAIHRRSPRGSGPMVSVNCAALSETLLESELFGHEKGAFTGATERRAGKFEQADGGTLFLDEVGELSPRCQAKLLRVLEERRVERVGGGAEVPVDVRVIAATHRDLAAMVREGTMRQDLYYRLEVLVGVVPPLRERRADVAMLADRFLHRFAAQAGRRRHGFSTEAIAMLTNHDWPGNVRELRNVIERIAVLGDSDPVSAADVERALGQAPGRARPAAPAPATGQAPAAAPPAVRTLDEAEREAVIAAYTATGGNKLRAAELLGIDRTTLYKKLKRYNLE